MATTGEPEPAAKGKSVAKAKPARKAKATGKAKQPETAGSRPEFTIFMNLPAELRRMIWQLALPRRVVDLGNFVAVQGYTYKMGRGYDGSFENAGIQGRRTTKGVDPPVPVIAAVCRESRAVTFETGKLFLIKRGSMVYGGVLAGPQYAWFDPARDVLHLSVRSEVNEFDFRYEGGDRDERNEQHFSCMVHAHHSWWPHFAEVPGAARRMSIFLHTKPKDPRACVKLVNLMMRDSELFPQRRDPLVVIQHITVRHYNHVDMEDPLVRDFAEDGGALVSLEDFDELSGFLAKYLPPKEKLKRRRRLGKGDKEEVTINGLADICRSRQAHAQFVDLSRFNLMKRWLIGGYCIMHGIGSPTGIGNSLINPSLVPIPWEEGWDWDSGFDFPWCHEVFEAMPMPKMDLSVLVRICMHKKGDAETGWPHSSMPHSFKYLR